MNRKFNRAVGNVGEAIACEFLCKRGFEIVRTNYRNKHGEIDIIARIPQVAGLELGRVGRRNSGVNDMVYHFVEVKMRSGDAFGLGRDAVNRYKQKRIRSVAQYFLLESKLDSKVFSCFDVIEISGDVNQNKVELLENCF